MGVVRTSPARGSIDWRPLEGLASKVAWDVRHELAQDLRYYQLVGGTPADDMSLGHARSQQSGIKVAAYLHPHEVPEAMSPT